MNDLEYIPIPYNNFSSRNGLGEKCLRFGTNVETKPTVGDTACNVGGANLKE